MFAAELEGLAIIKFDGYANADQLKGLGFEGEGAIEGVAKYGMANPGQVGADLVAKT